ncbi:MAG: bacillithiol biosynthesis cysteine-adding enzyme BshC [Chitinophagaceae bacterium]
MDCISTSLPYEQVGHFSSIILDYLNNSPQLKPFFEHPVSIEGIKRSIDKRKNFPTNRRLLVDVLQRQYAGMPSAGKVQQNISDLALEHTFTIVTAHQPNIFTGYLYFIYKILHVIKLADHLAEQLPRYTFVPLFYMGSEDADLDELGNFFLSGEKLVWETDQKGAVGRMNTKGLENIIDRIAGELTVYPFGNEMISLLKQYYLPDTNIQTATFKLIHALFEEYGLVVLIPDNASLKESLIPVFKDDLLYQTSSTVVGQTIEKLSKHYKVQANPRDINLFFLQDGLRERIIKNGNDWKVVGENIRFSDNELQQELVNHPERFSPNVILRGLFQESILPNIAFIGGGGEMAYWLELKELFSQYAVPFPVLILRNSFLFVEKKWKEKVKKLGFSIPDLFKDERLLLDELVRRNSSVRLDLDTEITELDGLFLRVKQVAGNADITLQQHVEALKTGAKKQLNNLEKKMVRAEKRKYDDQQRQIHNIKNKLFPRNGLQERIDNFMPYYAQYGKDFIRMLYEHSPALEQKFVVLEEV